MHGMLRAHRAGPRWGHRTAADCLEPASRKASCILRSIRHDACVIHDGRQRPTHGGEEPGMAVTCMPRMAAALATMVLLAGCATSSVQQPAAGPEEAGQAQVDARATVTATRPPGPAAGLPVATEQPSMPAGQLRDGLLRVLEALHTQDMNP